MKETHYLNERAAMETALAPTETTVGGRATVRPKQTLFICFRSETPLTLFLSPSYTNYAKFLIFPFFFTIALVNDFLVPLT